MKLVVAIGGASGAIYAKRLLDELRAHAAAIKARQLVEAKAGARVGAGLEVGVVFSSAGREVWTHEIGDETTQPFKTYGLRDFRAPFASGSAGWDAMVVIPCSTGGLARIAHGISDDLIGRAADVMLKERRKLVLVVRETPLNDIHLENMLKLSRMGVVILPPVPAFYNRPQSIPEMVDQTVMRILDQFDIHMDLTRRWDGEMAPGRVQV